MPKKFPSCFVSVSFAEEDVELREWFLDILRAFNFQPVGGDVPEPRPPPEKIRDRIREADAFVGILTRREKLEGEDRWKAPNWVMNEIGMAYDAEKPIAFFVEKGVDHKGLGDWVADYVEFERTDLRKAVPQIIRFLTSLREGLSLIPDVSGAKRQICLALANELSNFLIITQDIESSPEMPWTVSFWYARTTGRVFELSPKTLEKVELAYASISEMSELASSLSSLQWRIDPPFPLGRSRHRQNLQKEKDEVVSRMLAIKERVVKAIQEAGFSLIMEAEPKIASMVGHTLKAPRDSD